MTGYYYKLHVICFTMIVVAAPAIAAEEIPFAPAEFAFYLTSPSSSEQIVRPTAIFYDRTVGEIFVGEQGHNRITIFDSTGQFKHEIYGGSHFSSPSDLAVDADGYIWVLGSSKGGRRLVKFDFDGQHVKTYPIPTQFDGIDVSIGSFDLTSEGQVFLMDVSYLRVLEMSAAGDITNSFEVLTDYEGQERLEQVVGKIRIYGDHILIVSGTAGSVYIYDFDGNWVRKVGRRGSEAGNLIFPVAAVMTDDGSVVTLDKRSHNFVCFNPSGKPIAEIGGRGISPGWFYQPTLLEISTNGLLIIGQIYDNKLQACYLPKLLLAPQNRIDSDTSEPIGVSLPPTGNDSSSSINQAERRSHRTEEDTFLKKHKLIHMKRTLNLEFHGSTIADQCITWRYV